MLGINAYRLTILCSHSPMCLCLVSSLTCKNNAGGVEMSFDSVTDYGRVFRPSFFTSAVELSRRMLYMLLGICLTMVGLVSIVLPFIPTTTTLLASSFFLSRSLPRLQNFVKELPIIGRHVKYLDGTRIMTTTAQSGICVYLWVNLLVTCASLYGVGLASYPIVSIHLFCCVLSTVFIQKFHAERTKISQAIAVECASASNTTSQESQVLASVDTISREIDAVFKSGPPTSGPQIPRGLPMHQPQSVVD